MKAILYTVIVYTAAVAAGHAAQAADVNAEGAIDRVTVQPEDQAFLGANSGSIHVQTKTAGRRTRGTVSLQLVRDFCLPNGDPQQICPAVADQLLLDLTLD